MHYVCNNVPTLPDLNPDENNQGMSYYPFLISIDMCNGSCNTVVTWNRIFIANKEKVNI